MRYRFLFSFLKSSLLTKGIGKIRLFLNVAIFLSVFAISSTLISIYYESKITQIEKKIADETTKIKVIMKNWYLKTNKSNNVRNKYKIKTIVDRVKLIVDVIVIKWSGFKL